jgi:uncharacterized protein (TIGR03437 family)
LPDPSTRGRRLFVKPDRLHRASKRHRVPTFLGDSMLLRTSRFHSVLALTGLFAAVLSAQASRIKGPIQSAKRVTLAGHVRPQVQAANDDGPADSSLELSGLTLVLRPSAEQQAALDQLLKDQQDPTSPNYHHWLSPYEYAQRFGASQEDIDHITAWLKQQSLSVTSVARARNSIRFSGTAGVVGAAFTTQIRHYLVNGKRHFANATDPTIPSDLEFMVSAIQGLDDFHLQPRAVKSAALAGSLNPAYTSSTGRHYLAPDDVAIIYNIKPLYSAGVDGTGQTVVVAGQTSMDMTDVLTFRSHFGLSAIAPQAVLVPGLRDPGVSSDDVDEANLDLQWSGAVARNARILYVYSENVMDAVQYAIDQNLAPVISVSYGLCEPESSSASLRAFQTWAQQANAEGISWVNSAGDSGGADCADGKSNPGGLAVDTPASVPEITGIGGTTLVEDSGTYWNASNGTTLASVLSYIPETVWNDSTTNSPGAGGGGASIFFQKPSWQTGAGVPNNGARNVPDISLAASPDHNGYLVYTGGTLSVFGGTSLGAPTFSGMVALLNHYQVLHGGASGMGNLNQRLYSLAQTSPGVFHDVTSGNNLVTITCTARQRNCVAGTFGYNAGAGYDQATGLGSVNAYNLVTNWTGAANAVTPGTTSMILSSNVASVDATGSITLTASVTATNGGVPLGSVTFQAGGASVGTAVLSAGTSRSTATLNLAATAFVVGSNTISAQYSGSASYAAATASTSVTVTTVSSGPPNITSLGNGASFRTNYAPGMLLSIFGSQLAPAAASASTVPLPSQMAGVTVTINGENAPLLYVSPTQLNIQLPYEVTPNTTATIVVNNNGNTGTSSLTPADAAPGIFVDSQFEPVPSTSGARGQIVTLFVTGAGTVSPPVATGTAPTSGTPLANLPKPQGLTVTVGGLPATVEFAGIPANLVGVVQVNYQIPAAVPLGANAVVVQVAGVSSPPANITVTP